MPSSFVDLHCHSTASDGTLPPAEVVRLAVEIGLSALALTDHDTIGGVAEAAAEAKRLNLDFLPGIEISAEYPLPGTLHLLGYGVDPQSTILRDLTKTLLAGRDNRNPKIIDKLQKLGVSITMDERGSAKPVEKSSAARTSPPSSCERDTSRPSSRPSTNISPPAARRISTRNASLPRTRFP